MPEYTVTIRDEADVKTLEQWADDEFRTGRPADQLNAEVRKLLQQHAKAKAPGQPRQVRGPRSARAA